MVNPEKMDKALATFDIDHRRTMDSVVARVLPYLNKQDAGLVVFDIGSNVGTFSKAIRAELPKSTIHAFEPSLRHHEYHVSMQGDDSKTHINNVGAGLEESTLTLWTDDNNLGWNTLVEAQCTANMQARKVSIVPLDSYIEENNSSRIDLVKLDTEGFEYEALKGMYKSLQKLEHKPVMIVELGWGKHHPEWERNKEFFTNMIGELGYEPVELERGGTDDVLFIPIRTVKKKEPPKAAHMNKTKHLSILLLYMGGCDVRLKNLHAIIDYYLWAAPGAELILIEQDTNTAVDERVIHKTFDTDDGHFRRGLCFNLGYAVSTRDVLLCVDSDLLVERHVLEDKELLAKNDLVVPYKKVRDISKRHLDDVLEDITKAFKAEHTVRGYANEGGAVFLKRTTFGNIGGFTAGFIGYGAEDNDFLYKARSLGYKVGRTDTNSSLHLYHPGSSKQSSYNRDNDNLRDGLQNVPVKTLKNICATAALTLKRGYDAIVQNELDIPTPDSPGTGFSHPLRFLQLLDALREEIPLMQGEYDKSGLDRKAGDNRDSLYRFHAYLLTADRESLETICALMTDADFFPIQGRTYTRQDLLTRSQEPTKERMVTSSAHGEEWELEIDKNVETLYLYNNGLVEGNNQLSFWWVKGDYIYLVGREGDAEYKLWKVDAATYVDSNTASILRKVADKTKARVPAIKSPRVAVSAAKTKAEPKPKPGRASPKTSKRAARKKA